MKISLNFVPNDSINNFPALVHIMAWHRSGDKPLCEQMMVSLPTHICVTRPQWVKHRGAFLCKKCALTTRIFYRGLPALQLVVLVVIGVVNQPLDSCMLATSWKYCFKRHLGSKLNIGEIVFVVVVVVVLFDYMYVYRHGIPWYIHALFLYLRYFSSHFIFTT